MHYPSETTYGEFKDAYRENVRVALEHVQRLLGEVEGWVVVTADHGELLGERMWPIPVRYYDHPASLVCRELREVPWLEIANGPRREVCSAPPPGGFDVDGEVQQRRLQALGYRE